MNSTAEYIDYSSTLSFSNLVNDYINGHISLKPFYAHTPNLEGIIKAIEERRKNPTNRKLLVEVLQKQYSGIALTEKQQQHLSNLEKQHCFTITTAHQPNLFTGHLYFVYKILHAVKLAEHLKSTLPEYDFVPVYYMGSEDADLEELNHIYIKGEKYEWKTQQTGAVGRMKVDKDLLNLIDVLAGQLLIEPHGEEVITLLKSCYKMDTTIEQASFMLVNQLFASYGLIVLLPDDPALKKSFIPIVIKEIKDSFSHKAVLQTVDAFPKEYKVQASGREINLFYLKDNRRDRIVFENGTYHIKETDTRFNATEIIHEINEYPERFSPNVILRPVFQEMILPNITFIGGGGEIAYWLELKKVFDATQIPFPVLLLRNSFLMIPPSATILKNKLNLTFTELFKSKDELLNSLVKNNTKNKLSLVTEKQHLDTLYSDIMSVAVSTDSTLQKHVMALKTQALKRLDGVEKKMLRAEKKKFEAEQRQLQKLKEMLFPNQSLQERVENIFPFYASYGKNILETIFQHSLSLEQRFGILELG